MKKIFLITLLFIVFLLSSCDFIGSSGEPHGAVQLSANILDEHSTIEYTFKNTSDISLYVVMNGGLTNIEKWTDSGWEQMMSSLPHRPALFYAEVNPSDTFTGNVNYEFILSLGDTPTGRYRIKLYVAEARSQEPTRIFTSSTFRVE